jgi:hypothetical protein
VTPSRQPLDPYPGPIRPCRRVVSRCQQRGAARARRRSLPPGPLQKPTSS